MGSLGCVPTPRGLVAYLPVNVGSSLQKTVTDAKQQPGDKVRQ